MFLQATSKILLGFVGWSIKSSPPDSSQYVLLGAHHTSNWDFPLALLGMRAMGIPFHWVAKHTLFFWPLGIVFRKLGGVAVDRNAAHGFVDEAAALFSTNDRLVLAIAPDGTRSKVRFWKTGFYQIASKAEVPIAFGYLDYKTKTIGVAEGINSSGVIENDMPIIRDFYRNVQAKYQDRVSDMALRSEIE
jgi:1-acyl-sn-glycerol-3-phosphate acyltransferase